MKTFRNALLLVLFAVVNYYGFKYTFAGLNYANDLAFIGGLLGAVVLVIADFLLVYNLVKSYARKVEDKLCLQNEQAEVAAVPATPSQDQPQPQN